jgi:hypothetical protein
MPSFVFNEAPRSSLLRRSSCFGGVGCCGDLHSKTLMYLLLYRDVEDPSALQLEVSARMPHPVGSCDQRNTIWGNVELGGVLKKDLIGHLRSRHRMRHAQSASTTCQPHLHPVREGAGEDTTSVVTALSTQIRQLPAALRRSLTWDRGVELARHKHLTVDTAMRVYFCDPQSPWQRGTDEHTNRLVRVNISLTAQTCHAIPKQT